MTAASPSCHLPPPIRHIAEKRPMRGESARDIRRLNDFVIFFPFLLRNTLPACGTLRCFTAAAAACAFPFPSLVGFSLFFFFCMFVFVFCSADSRVCPPSCACVCVYLKYLHLSSSFVSLFCIFGWACEVARMYVCRCVLRCLSIPSSSLVVL